MADWDRYFRAQLAEEPWRDVLARWWPRLLPGLAAAATHGVIRTSHAARSLAAAEQAALTPPGGPRTRPRARLLGGPLPGAARPPADRRPAGPGRRGQRAAGRRRPPAAGLIFETLTAELAGQPGFGAAVGALRGPTDVPADLAALAREFARVFLVYGRTRPIALLHSVTAPVAARSVLPLLPAEVARPTYDALWQVGAALYAVYTGGDDPRAAARRPAPVGRRAGRPRRRHRRRARHQADRGLPAAGRGDARSAAAPRGGRAWSCSASLIRMAKAGGRRQAGEGAGPPAAELPGPGPAARPDQGAAPSQQELVAAAIGAAVQAVCDGRRDADGAHLDPLAIERTPGWTQAVSRAIVEYLRASVTRAWQRGWQPAELARHVGRELSADHAAMVADMITAEMLGYAAATVDDRWAAQAAALEAAAPGKGAWWGSDADYLRAWYALGRDPEFIGTVATAVETLHAFHHLPALEKLLPLPGTARPAGRRQGAARQPGRPAGPADERMLSRIRALLAKAESTEFAEEAEALSGRAQELMAKYSIDHALLAAETGKEESRAGGGSRSTTPTRRRRRRCCRSWRRPTAAASSGPRTSAGHGDRLPGRPGRGRAAVHLAAGPGQHRDAADRGQAGRAGRSRTRAFRQSFLLAYAVRIGERLSEAADHAEQEAVAEQRAADGGGAPARPRPREEGHRPGAVPRGAPPGGRRRGRRDVRIHAHQEQGGPGDRRGGLELRPRRRRPGQPA